MSEVWTHETIEAPIDNGIDEVSLALQTDAWGRTYRTKVITTHPGSAAIRSLRGLVITPDAKAVAGRYVIQSGAKPAAAKLNEAFAEMGRRYGQARPALRPWAWNTTLNQPPTIKPLSTRPYAKTWCLLVREPLPLLCRERRS